jgi:ribosome-binding factor A
MNNRLQRVEMSLRREIAAAIVKGEVHDPRVAAHVAEISVTGVKVAPDLGSARVFVDVLSQGVDLVAVLKGLNAASSAVRAIVGSRIQLKRTPSLRFEKDPSIGRGLAVEQVLADLELERRRQAAADAVDADEDEDEESEPSNDSDESSDAGTKGEP